MRKLLVFVVIVVAAAAGYSFYWHKKADDFLQMVQQSVTNINEGAKPITKDLTLIKYDSMHVTGFPMAMVLEITKPSVNLPVSEMMKSDPKVAASAGAFEWVEQISYGDKVTLTGNVMGNSYTLTTNGDRVHKSLVNKQERHSLAATSAGPLTCNLGVEAPKGGTPWTMQPIFTNPETFIAIFRSFDCNVNDVAIKDTKGETIFSLGKLAYSLTNKNDTGYNHKLAVQFVMEKAKSTTAFDAQYHDYITMFYTLQGKQKLAERMPTSMAVYGETNYKFDIAYTGPTDKKYFSDPGMSMHFDVNAFNMQTDIANMLYEMHFANAPQDNERVISLSLHGTSDSTERYDQLIKQMAVAVIGDLGDAEGKTGMEADLAQGIAKAGTPEDIASAVTPQSHLLGKSAFDIDLTVKGPNEGKKFLMQANAKLDKLDWVAEPYGIKMNGSSTTQPGRPMPLADLKIDCLSCDALVSDLGNYMLRVQTLFLKGAGNTNPPYLTADLLEGVKQFLHGISENATAKDLSIHLSMKDTGMTVSGKQIPEVLALYGSTIASKMPQMSPAAGSPPRMPAQ